MAFAPYQEVERCRICGNQQLDSVLNLGVQQLTGVFPKTRDQHVSAGPLELVKCREDGTTASCGLLQLRHSFNADEMYRGSYGYRSGLNEMMVQHLQSIVGRICKYVTLGNRDVVLDIGSNDATLLKAYPRKQLALLGIDPSAENFREFYTDEIALVTDYFSAGVFHSVMGSRKAKVVTSIAMFYDLPAPLEFMREIKEILADDGVWVFEQSYMPLMLTQDAYDTVCHEHVEYYGLRQVQWMVQRAGLKILDVELNDVNGGSFCVTVTHADAPATTDGDCPALLARERDTGLDGLAPYADFRGRVFRHRDELRLRINGIRQSGKSLLGYGASTKGNVILQFCGLSEREIPAIADRNPAKFGSFTPGTLIPIISEDDARARRPDYFLALPWHFREGFLRREKEFLRRGGQFLFPLPTIVSIGA
ncbi:MAG TPA: class I SAM-dependent methyltransferase [Verrucomicrobiae bacterium]|nr:class I SAM-dependent methyltransferase [Verrucomicrobiae bacterium]